MTRLDAIIERIRDLPPERQEIIAAGIDLLLEDETGTASRLTPEQWAEIERALQEHDEPEADHADVMARAKALLDG